MRAASSVSNRALANACRRRTWREPSARKRRRSPSISGPENARALGRPPCAMSGSGAAEPPAQAARVNRFGDEAVAARIVSELLGFDHYRSRESHDEHLAGAGILAELARQLQTVHAGQLEVDQQEAGDQGAERDERLFGGGRQMHLVAFAAQHGGGELQTDRRVVHNEDGFTSHETREYSADEGQTTMPNVNGARPGYAAGGFRTEAQGRLERAEKRAGEGRLRPCPGVARRHKAEPYPLLADDEDVEAVGQHRRAGRLLAFLGGRSRAVFGGQHVDAVRGWVHGDGAGAALGGHGA